MHPVRLFFRYIHVSIRSQMQYRLSFLMTTAGHFFTTVVEIISIWFLFNRFNGLADWTLGEIGVIYGITHIAFALAEAAARGFDIFSVTVKNGDFDRILLRPRSTLLQIAAQEFRMNRAGRFIQAVLVLVWGISSLGTPWTLEKTGMVIFAIAGGTCLFYGLFVIQATLAFWSTETLEIMNILTYGGTEAGQYPMNIFHPWFRRVFTFVIPLACVSYYPALSLTGNESLSPVPGWILALAPCLGVLFLLICIRFWHFGVRHYRSTGS